MTMRGLEGFVTTHMDETGKLVKRMGNGLTSNKYKAIDYDKLRSIAAEKKHNGEKMLQKVQKLKNVSKQSKENHLLKQHRGIWTRELSRLHHAKKKMEVEFDLHLKQCIIENGSSDNIFRELEEQDAKLEIGRNKFKKFTVEPIEELQEDLNYWIKQYGGDVITEEIAEEHDRVLETIYNVKVQQEQLVDKLNKEQMDIERQLKNYTLEEILDEPKIIHGIPPEAYKLTCPYPDLKASVLEEFILLDQKYMDKLDDLDYNHYFVLNNSCGGWLEDENKLFTVIIEQYPHDISKRRMLYIDRLCRQFKTKTRQEIVEHEEWLLLWKFYNERKRDLFCDWKRDRNDLFSKVKVLFEDASTKYELQLAKSEHTEKQKEVCKLLQDQVSVWREKREEAIRQQEELGKKQIEAAMLKRQIEEEKEQERRLQNKNDIVEFKKRQLELKRKEDQKAQIQLKKLELLQEEQAKVNQERVRFRELKFRKKVDEQKRKEEEIILEQEEQEQRLELLRERVRPNVECDLLRVWSDTESWHSRVKREEDIHIQEPLFKVNTFTSKQVTSDPRYKLEEKLRAAGLHGNVYARHIIANTQGSHAPRRDTMSTVFKQ